MDETLRKQIDAWTETDEHGRIVDMLGQISPEERKRVQDFWKWFTDNEEELSRIVENRGQLDGGDAVEFVTAGTNLIDEDVHFNLGGDYEFTFSPNITSIFPTSFRVVICAGCMKRRMTSLRNKNESITINISQP